MKIQIQCNIDNFKDNPLTLLTFSQQLKSNNTHEINNNNNTKPKPNINRIKLARYIKNNYVIYFPVYPFLKNSTIKYCNEFIEG